MLLANFLHVRHHRRHPSSAEFAIVGLHLVFWAHRLLRVELERVPPHLECRFSVSFGFALVPQFHCRLEPALADETPWSHRVGHDVDVDDALADGLHAFELRTKD